MNRILKIFIVSLLLLGCRSEERPKKYSDLQEYNLKDSIHISDYITIKGTKQYSYAKSEHYKRILGGKDTVEIKINRASPWISREYRNTEYNITKMGTIFSSTEYSDKKRRYGTVPADEKKYARLLYLLALGQFPENHEYRSEDCWSCETNIVEIITSNHTITFSYDYIERLDFREYSELISLLQDLTNGN